MKHYVGLDISMKEAVICIVDEKGKVAHKGRVKTDPEAIAKHLKKTKLEIERIGLESGSLSHWLVDKLEKEGLPVICLDARKMAAVLAVRINKTDDNDAFGIANAVRCNLYRPVARKSREAIEVASLMRSRRTLVEQRVQLSNSVRGFLKSYGIVLNSCGQKEFTNKTRASLAQADEGARLGIEALLLCYEKLLEEIEKLDRVIEELGRKDPDIQLLMTIPGIGYITAMSYKAEIDDPERFKKSRDVGAYLGMTPRQYSSGETVKQGRISKCGSAEVRFLLMEAALVLLTRSKKWSRLKVWGLKLMKRCGVKKALMAVGRKLAVIMHRMLLTRKEFIYGEEPTPGAKEKRCVA